jgi:copper chaperone CopZ
MVDGVKSVQVDRPGASATVEYDAAAAPSSAVISNMIAMIEKVGFNAQLQAAA